MALLLLISIGLSFLKAPHLLDIASILSAPLHLKCLEFIPGPTVYSEALGALVCGQALTNSSLKTTLQKLSLIHLFVVSGSHLLLIDQIFSKTRVPLTIRIIALGLYSLITGWQAPAVRALIQILTKLFLIKKNSYFPADLRVLLAGFFTLLIFPEWWNSLSLLMSWSASLALSWRMPGDQTWRRTLLQQTLIWILMLGPLWGLGSLHPLSCLYNLILGPLIGLFLFPLAVMTFIFPTPGISVFESFMTFFTTWGAHLAEPIIKSELPMASVPKLWTWLCLWHIGFHFARIYRCRSQEADA